jgi:electron transfer flavoprotein beta subunit
MRAKKAEIEKLSAADIGLSAEEVGLKGSPTRVIRVFAPEKRPGGVKWKGEPLALAARLAEELVKRQLV